MNHPARPLRILLAGLLLICSALAQALTIEITQGAEGALPIAVVPMRWTGDAGRPPSEDLSAVVSADLARSGRFKPLPRTDMLARPSQGSEVDFRDWRAVNVDTLVVGQVKPNGPGGYLVRFQLFDVYRGEQLAGYSIPTTEADLRGTAHSIADLIYEALTGEPGAFATRIAYISSVATPDGKQRVELQIADADGENPQTIVSSLEPLLSPNWSPDGRKIVYVSFEQGRPAVWLQEVFTGRREKLTNFKGINGAPAFSPDGRRLALTLSKDGNPDIFVLDLASRQLKALTRHWAIDTEPSWSPDGKQIVFTSDRGGSPQIYRMPATGGEPSRLTFDGSYNAKASYSPDGKSLVLVTRENGAYRIGVLDLDNRSQRVVSDGKLDESPSFAPNGSMIIYGARVGGKGVLAAVSTDGRVRQRLKLQTGDVREPVWSPFYQRRVTETD
jgi:TolB protein